MSVVDAERPVVRLAPREPEPGLLEQRVALDLDAPTPRQEYLPSDALRADLFYQEALAIVSGHKKSGKTLAVGALAVDVLRDGRPVVYIDMENGRALITLRFKRLGATQDLMAGMHYVPFPTGLTLENLAGRLEAVARELPGALVVVDSLRGLIGRLASRAGAPFSVNDPIAIEGSLGPLNAAVKQHGLTVLVIDHAKKGGEASDEYSTANSAAKEQIADVVYFWTKVENYSEVQRGAVELRVTSDRFGQLPVSPQCWRVGGQGEGNPVSYQRVSADEVGAAGRIREAVLEHLIEHPAQTFTKTDLEHAVDGKGALIRAAVEALANDDRAPVSRVDGPRKGTVRYQYDPEEKVPV